ncbi:hypothetical protein [Streptomyces sp. JNUCC 63]
MLVRPTTSRPLWDASGLPTGADRRDAVAERPPRQVPLGVQTLVCYLDRNDEPDSVSVTAADRRSALVDTAHLY